MDMNYIRAIVREMEDELTQRKTTFIKLINGGKMTKAEANMRYLRLEEAKKLMEAYLKDEHTKIALNYTPDEIAEELMTEIGFRKKVYGFKVFKQEMTKFDVERKIGYFQFAYNLIAPPKPKVAPEPPSLFDAPKPNNEKQLQFLKTWGLAFRQGLKDNPTRTDYAQFEKMCLDAYNQMTGGRILFNTHLEDAFMTFRDYLYKLNAEKAFSSGIYEGHLANLAAIEEQLLLTV